MQVTVNYLLAMEKSLRQRLAQLESLKNESSKRTIWERMGEGNNKIEEPTYDIKKVDKKITLINKALFEINHKIKTSNALTNIDIISDYDSLISEID